jgi:uncharacterized membrane protein YheB (UPF0754 family)
MVERELLPPELLRLRLARPEVREKLKQMFAGTEGPDDPYDKAVSSLIGLLRKSDVHRELEARGRVLLGRTMLQLNVFQRLFISAAQYDETLNQRMPFIIDDLIDQADHLLRENKETVAGFLSGGLIDAADGQLEGLLASLNVRTLVSERIDSLEMIRVERIILDVMANQLKWIDVFGAVLGFLIGLFQVLLTRLM